MSGFCALVRLDAGPADAALLEQMTARMARRGPDGIGTWTEGPAGMGHTLLATSPDAMRERQPLSLDGAIWIVADARIDGRAELAAALKSHGCQLPPAGCDAGLILHAYDIWGTECVQHLIGDFAFVIWDRNRRRLFAARDHFGIKPFFYAHLGQELVCSNSLACIRSHPSVSDRLNKAAIADFLLLDRNHEPATTAFEDIRRLPAGSTLIGENGCARVQGYWSVPEGLRIVYRDPQDYVSHFGFLLRQAVSDRLRTDRVAVAMSGGLDSTIIAALACAELGDPRAVRAQTVVYERLIPDREREFASMAARHMGIAVDFVGGDGYRPYEAHQRGLPTLPDPLHNPGVATYLEATRLSARHARVVLTGWDGDTLLNESPKPYFASLLAEGRFVTAAAAMAGYAANERRILPQGFWRRPGNRPRQDTARAVPPWIAPEFARRHDLTAHLREHSLQRRPPHRVRPSAYRNLHALATDPTFFDGFDPESTGSLVEYRHPLLDLRLVHFALSLPPFPWCVRKEILRRAAEGLLPACVRTRPKTALPGAPMHHQLQRADSRWIDRFEPDSRLGEFVDTAMIPPVHGAGAGTWEEAWTNLRPLSLNFWLQGL